MTQEELDALINADDLDSIEIDETPHEVAIVKDLNDVNNESEIQGATITDKLSEIINELDAIKLCIDKDEQKKAYVIIGDVKNICFELIELMQYQDIHRQKIERAMNKIVEITNLSEDELKKLSINISKSAKSIEGDENLSSDEIENLLKEYKN